jgi:nitrogenase molybdenum-iron protein NifN
MLLGFSQFLHGVGAKIVVAVASVKAECLADAPCAQVRVGDLEDLERIAAAANAQLIIGSSHAAQAAERLNLPLLRAGFPLYDRVGAYARPWIGYRGGRQALFDFANLILGQHHDIPAYRSRFWQDGPREWESDRPAAGAGLVRH